MRKKLIYDPKAPRYDPDSTHVCTMPFVNRFFRKNPDYMYFKDLYDWKEIQYMIKRFNENLSEVAIDTREGIALPERLGSIYLASIEGVNAINHKLSNELGRNVYQTNNHSDGKVLKICHTSRGKQANFEFKGLWKFFPSQSFQQRASKKFAKNWPMYIEKSPYREIEKRAAEFYEREKTSPPKFILKKLKKYQ